MMNRKKFLTSVAAVTALGQLPVHAQSVSVPRPLIPSYLAPGDTIGITSPAGYITEAKIQPALEQIRSWGFNPRIGRTIGRRQFGFGGTDIERADDFQAMLDDPSIKAILCARGGYGVIRIIDQLNFDRFVRHPKWIVGFSDVTVLHSHINKHYGIASIHSKMCNSFPDNWESADVLQRNTILSIKQTLEGGKLKYPVAPSPHNKTGVAEGVLVGGNLKTLESLAGTNSDLYTNGKILFVEDTGEYLYSIDRMFWNLKRTGKLTGLKGLILGGFKIKPDDPGEEFGIPLQQIVLDKIRDYHYPVCFDFPVGHQKNNFAVKCGVFHRLEVSKDSCTLEEIF